jgi:hypothetical protein
MKMRAFLDRMMMETVRTSETLAHSNETSWHYIPEGSHRHTHYRENLKSHNFIPYLC